MNLTQYGRIMPLCKCSIMNDILATSRSDFDIAFFVVLYEDNKQGSFSTIDLQLKTFYTNELKIQAHTATVS
jgi:hypothetical protein